MNDTPDAALPPVSRIFAGLLPAPVGLALQLGGGHAAGWSCGSGAPLLLHGLSFAGLLLALAADVLCWRALQRADGVWRATGANAAAQARFLALGVTAVAFIATGVVVLAWLSLVLLDACG